jgi:ketosteroid isomerase-like protein
VSDAVEANLALAQRAYELWNTGGLEAMIEHVVTPDMVFHEIPEAPDTGVFRGAEVAARMREIVEMGGHFQLKVRSLEGRGDHVLAALDMSARGTSSGVAGTMPLFHVLRVGEGRLREMRAYLDADQARREYERLTSSSG